MWWGIDVALPAIMFSTGIVWSLVSTNRCFSDWHADIWVSRSAHATYLVQSRTCRGVLSNARFVTFVHYFTLSVADVCQWFGKIILWYAKPKKNVGEHTILLRVLWCFFSSFSAGQRTNCLRCWVSLCKFPRLVSHWFQFINEQWLR